MKKSFVLDAALALAHAGPTLALHPGAIGRAFALPGEDEPIGETAASSLDGVALLHVRGPLTQRSTMHMCGVSLGYDLIVSGFTRLMADPSVRAVVLVIDSPGGDVAGLFTAVEKMTAVRDASRKPVFAFADELMCSAAYALATVATGGIYLPASGEVGSVGVLSIHADESNASDTVYTVFRSGSRKAEGNPLEPLSDVAKTTFQARVDSLASQFFALVSKARPSLSVDQVAGLQGASFLGSEAVQVGLADGVGSLDSVLSLAASAASGATMSDDQMSEIESLKARLADAEAKLAALEKEEAPADEEEAPADAAPSDEEEEEETPADAKAEIARLNAELAKRDIQAAVDQASREGKVEPSKRAAMVALGNKLGIDGLKVVLDALPAHVVTGSKKSKSSENTEALTALEATIAKQMGITPEVFASTKARIAKVREG